jgi:hypothetical protein
VKDVLAEDFVLGEVYGRAGKRVVLSALAVDNINIAGGLSRFASRHIRWLQMRVVVHVLGFLADLGSNAAFFALVAAAWSGASEDWARYVGVVLYKGAIDAWLLAHIRGRGLALRHLPALALRDLLQPAMWLVALFSRTTEWRGARFRLLKGSRLEPLPRRSVLAPPPVAVSELVPSSPPTPGPQQVEHRG